VPAEPVARETDGDVETGG